MSCRALIVCLITFMACACSAHVAHKPAAPDSTGIRYYRASPYLLVYSNSKGGLKWQILYLPDQTKMMTAEPTVTGGRSEVTLYFRNGILAGSSELGDTTELPKAVLAAVQSVVPLLALGLLEVKENKVPAPYLYKIIVEGDNVSFRGNQGDAGITVPVLKGGKL
jgi:hypothetical protein